MKKLLFAGLALPLLAVSAHAAPITPTVTYTEGSTYNTTALTGFTTTSANMVGSIVTVSFAGGSVNSGTWTASGASNTGWSLTLAGNSFSSDWTFTNTGSLAITGFTFDGVPGNTTFDTVNGPFDSPGSADGNPFGSVTGPAGLSVAALYTNQLQVGGVFYGDEYTTLDVRFSGTAFGSGSVLTFVADTDNAEADGGITSVPEPASWAMMVAGFGMVGFGIRRSRVKFDMNATA